MLKNWYSIHQIRMDFHNYRRRTRGKMPSQRLFRIVPCFALMLAGEIFGQTITINGAGAGRTFDGVGGVSGGGATSVLLLSYPEPQRSQILDFLFKPNFGASIQTHFCEVPGDNNSTQGSEPSHMHTAGEENCSRGYEWYIMKEAYKRNPAITFDGVAWGCPGWVGNGNFWSADMHEYYIKWIKGLKNTYGITLDAIGCRNESGSNTSWLIQFHLALDAAGLSGVRIHGMDDWNGVQAKWGTADQLASDTALRNAIDILSAHTTVNTSWSETKVDATANAINSGKPLWDTEEHFMNQNSGYNQATAVVNAFNSNYIRNRVTKTVFWYLICCTYPLEPWNDYGIMLAQEPWSGNYSVKPGLWGYAHYNQFVKVGWKFIDDACGNLSGGGTYVTLKSPDNSDFSVIIETKSAGASNPSFTVSGGLPTNKTLCVWRSTASEQFVRQADITPAAGSFSLAVQGDAIYSISTTTGQQKGAFDTIPVSKKFPLPYYENYDHYADVKIFGYLPYYHADICGVFELADRPDGSGRCLRQVLQQKAQSWAPEWSPYTIIGDRNWADYEVSADMYFDNGGWAGVMGRVNNVGTGYGCNPSGYYLSLSSTGTWALYYNAGSNGAGTSLSNGTVALSGQWHKVKLQLSGSTIKGFIENNQVCSVTNTSAAGGMAGLCTGNYGNGRNSALFDNLVLNTVNGAEPQPTIFSQDMTPPYAPASGLIEKTPIRIRTRPARMLQTTVGSQIIRIPKDFIEKNSTASVYDLKGVLVQKVTTQSEMLNFNKYHRKANEVFIVEFTIQE
jgi:galactosylceramidase